MSLRNRRRGVDALVDRVESFAVSQSDSREQAAKLLGPRHGSEVTSTEPVTQLGSELRSLRILVVDDDEDTRELMAAVLRRAGAEVACASCSGEALELFGRWTPDVVVSDLAMPGGGGYELVREVRRRDTSVGALAVSGFSGERDTARALEAGFNVHVGKPIEASDLVEAVREAARPRHQH